MSGKGLTPSVPGTVLYDSCSPVLGQRPFRPCPSSRYRTYLYPLPPVTEPRVTNREWTTKGRHPSLSVSVLSFVLPRDGLSTETSRGSRKGLRGRWRTMGTLRPGSTVVLSVGRPQPRPSQPPAVTSRTSQESKTVPTSFPTVDATLTVRRPGSGRGRVVRCKGSLTPVDPGSEWTVSRSGGVSRGGTRTSHPRRVGPGGPGVTHTNGWGSSWGTGPKVRVEVDTGSKGFFPSSVG